MNTLPVTGIRIHVIAWSAFVTYEILSVLPNYNWQFGNFWDYLVHYVLHICLFYFNAHVALPSTINERKRSYSLYFLLVLCEVFVYILLKFLILHAFIFFQIPLTPPFRNNSSYIISGIARALYFISFSIAYWIALTTLQNRKRIAELQNARLKEQIAKRKLETAIISTENAYLKSQINPHFLFNTLNFLYNSVSKFSTQLAESFMSLSEIMHYALSEIGPDGKVPLSSEIDNINNFIKLNQDRFRQKLAITFTVEGNVEAKTIVPLALMTLVENVFKYGDLSNHQTPATMALTVEEGKIIFNTKNHKKRGSRQESHGIGIKNLESRLAVHYDFKLDVEENEDDYRTVLQIWT